MAASGKTKGTKPGIAKARLAYLYGLNGQPPVVATKELAEIAGVGVGTIARYTPEWKVEAEKITLDALRSNGNSSLSISRLTVPDIVFDNAKKDVETIRKQVDLYAEQLDKLGSTIELLKGAIANFDDDKDTALRCFESFMSGVGSRASLLTNFLKAKAAYDKVSGLDSYSDIQVTRAKTVATLQAKAEVSEDKEEEITSESGLAFKRKA